ASTATSAASALSHKPAAAVSLAPCSAQILLSPRPSQMSRRRSTCFHAGGENIARAPLAVAAGRRETHFSNERCSDWSELQLIRHGGARPKGSQANRLTGCLFHPCGFAPEGGAPTPTDVACSARRARLAHTPHAGSSAWHRSSTRRVAACSRGHAF